MKHTLFNRCLFAGLLTAVFIPVVSKGQEIREIDLTDIVQKYPIIATGEQWPDHWVARGIVGQDHPSVKSNPQLANIPEYADFVAGTENLPRPAPGAEGGGFWPVLQRLRDPDTDQMTDRLGCLFRTGAIHLGPGGNLSVAFSDDRGQTWSEPTTVINYDPNLVQDYRNGSFGQAPNGDLLVMDWVSESWDNDLNQTGGSDFICCQLSRSTDMGQTWSTPQQLDFKQRLGFGVGPYGPIQRINETTLVVNLREGATDKSYLAWSYDNGYTWPEITTVSTDRKTETSFLPLEGQEWVGYTRQGSGGAWITRSHDGGKTWPDWEEVDPYRRRVPGSIVKLPDNKVAVIHGYRQFPFGARAFLSHDGGQTFDASISYVLNDAFWNEDCGYASAVTYEDGTVVAAAYTTKEREHPEWGTCAVAMVFNSQQFDIPDLGESIPLSNLFDDDTDTDLATAMATDTFGASAEETDLGVYQVANGDNDGVKTIAPGIDFDFTNLGGGTVGKGIANNTIQANDVTPLRITGQGPNNGGSALPGGMKVEDGIGSASDGRITFDLDEIRAAGGLEDSRLTFTATGAVNDSVVGHDNPQGCQFHLAAILSDESGVLAGQVNGQDVTVGDSGGTWSFTCTIPEHFDGHDGNGDGEPEGMIAADFFLSIPATAKWLTLVSTTEAGGNYADHSVWGDAQLNIVEDIPGDANGDGMVNHIDAEALATNWLSTNATWEMGDFNDDGIVDDADATLLAANWQVGVSQTASTPEPSGVALLLCGMAFLTMRI